MQLSTPADEGLTAIDPRQLTPDALRAALRRPQAWKVALPLERDPRYPEREGDTVMAAVLIALIARPEGVFVILTERASHLREHGGQVSFPGGRIEPSDASDEAAALREAHEETGMPQTHVEVLGRMPAYVTATGFSITPVVALVQPGFDYHVDAFEVAEVFEVPLEFLMDPHNHREHRVDMPDGRSRHYFSMTWKRFFIWGATAAMLRNVYFMLQHAQVATRSATVSSACASVGLEAPGAA